MDVECFAAAGALGHGGRASGEAAGRELGQQGRHGASPGPPRQGLSCCHGNRPALGAQCGIWGRDLKAGHLSEGCPVLGLRGSAVATASWTLALQCRGPPGLKSPAAPWRGVWQRGRRGEKGAGVHTLSPGSA